MPHGFPTSPSGPNIFETSLLRWPWVCPLVSVSPFLLESMDNTVRTPSRHKPFRCCRRWNDSLGVAKHARDPRKFEAGTSFVQRSRGTGNKVASRSQMADLIVRCERRYCSLFLEGLPNYSHYQRVPEEGKTTNSVNSAIVAGPKGTRVLLI